MPLPVILNTLAGISGVITRLQYRRRGSVLQEVPKPAKPDDDRAGEKKLLSLLMAFRQAVPARDW